MRNKAFLLAALLLGVTLHGTAQTTNYQAYSVFVYGLSKYMSWPTNDKTEFTIAVVGKSKVYDEMVKAYTGKLINGLPVKIVQVDDPQEVAAPQIMYVSDGKSNIIEAIHKQTEGKPVLIIAEREGLHKKGATMSFIAIDSKLRLDINAKELQNRHIKISTQLQALTNEVI
jgi:hypothetical protein